MEPADYQIWVDDHHINDDGDIVALARHARTGVEPEVGESYLVGDGDQTPFRAQVIDLGDDGVVILRALDDAATAGGATPNC